MSHQISLPTVQLITDLLDGYSIRYDSDLNVNDAIPRMVDSNRPLDYLLKLLREREANRIEIEEIKAGSNHELHRIWDRIVNFEKSLLAEMRLARLRDAQDLNEDLINKYGIKLSKGSVICCYFKDDEEFIFQNPDSFDPLQDLTLKEALDLLLNFHDETTGKWEEFSKLLCEETIDGLMDEILPVLENNLTAKRQNQVSQIMEAFFNKFYDSLDIATSERAFSWSQLYSNCLQDMPKAGGCRFRLILSYVRLFIDGLTMVAQSQGKDLAIYTMHIERFQSLLTTRY